MLLNFEIKRCVDFCNLVFHVAQSCSYVLEYVISFEIAYDIMRIKKFLNIFFQLIKKRVKKPDFIGLLICSLELFNLLRWVNPKLLSWVHSFYKCIYLAHGLIDCVVESRT